jgi:DNA repair exonuclease SbcCD ATPase subunit
MLEKMRVENFQAHELLDIEFDPLITTIVGPSDVGKSSILRALRWCCLNRPRGDGFIRRGSKRMRVRLKVGGDQEGTIRRERGGSENVYALGKSEYRAFGNDVPESIQRTLNLSELNFVGQHDAAFWFNLSPSEVARQLNKMVDLDSIDRATTSLSQHIRQLRVEMGVVSDRLDKAKKEYTDSKYVPNADADLKQVELWEDRWKVSADLSDRLGEVVGGLEESVKSLKVQRQRKKQLDDVVELGLDCKTKNSDIHWLELLIDGLEDSQKLMDVKVPNINQVGVCLKELQDIESDVSSLKSLVLGCQSMAARLDENRAALKKAKKQLTDELGGRCPLCGGEMK